MVRSYESLIRKLNFGYMSALSYCTIIPWVILLLYRSSSILHPNQLPPPLRRFYYSLIQQRSHPTTSTLSHSSMLTLCISAIASLVTAPTLSPPPRSHSSPCLPITSTTASLIVSPSVTSTASLPPLCHFHHSLTPHHSFLATPMIASLFTLPPCHFHHNLTPHHSLHLTSATASLITSPILSLPS